MKLPVLGWTIPPVTPGIVLLFLFFAVLTFPGAGNPYRALGSLVAAFVIAYGLVTAVRRGYRDADGDETPG